MANLRPPRVERQSGVDGATTLRGPVWYWCRFLGSRSPFRHVVVLVHYDENPQAHTHTRTHTYARIHTRTLSVSVSPSYT